MVYYIKGKYSYAILASSGFIEPNFHPCLIHSKTIYWHWENYSIWCRIPSREIGQLFSKYLNYLMTFIEAFLKVMSWVKVTGYITFFWLVGGEVTGGILGISVINLIVPTCLRSTCLWLPYSTPDRGLSFCLRTWSYISHCYAYILRRS